MPPRHSTELSSRTTPPSTTPREHTGIAGGIANFNFGIPGAPAPTLVLNNSTATGNAVFADGIGGGIANPTSSGRGREGLELEALYRFAGESFGDESRDVLVAVAESTRKRAVFRLFFQ